MKHYTIIGTVLLVIVLSIIPFIFKTNSESLNSIINTISTSISALASLITLVIALMLFNKYGIETSLLERNTKVVFDFLEELKKSKVFVIGNSYGVMIQFHNPFENIVDSQFPESWYYKDSLVFSTEYSDYLETLFKIADNPFMPKSISKKVHRLNGYILEVDRQTENLSEFATVDVYNPGKQREFKYGKFNGKNISFLEYLNMIQEVREETVNWIAKNSKYYPDLNI